MTHSVDPEIMAALEVARRTEAAVQFMTSGLSALLAARDAALARWGSATTGAGPIAARILDKRYRDLTASFMDVKKVQQAMEEYAKALGS